jgi:EAL domain-containing protein (putative c-di-GMP-specific phosphodiesterase class I)
MPDSSISTRPNDAFLVMAMSAMAQRPDLEVISEGVQTSEQRAFMPSHTS